MRTQEEDDAKNVCSYHVPVLRIMSQCCPSASKKTDLNGHGFEMVIQVVKNDHFFFEFYFGL